MSAFTSLFNKLFSEKCSLGFQNTLLLYFLYKLYCLQIYFLNVLYCFLNEIRYFESFSKTLKYSNCSIIKKFRNFSGQLSLRIPLGIAFGEWYRIANFHLYTFLDSVKWLLSIPLQDVGQKIKTDVLFKLGN